MRKLITKSNSYNKNLAILALLTATFGLSCSFFGYLTLPFAAAACTALFIYEDKNKRIASYIIPVSTFVVNFTINGFFSLEGIAYAIIAFLFSLLYVKKHFKADVAFVLTTITLMLILFSCVLIAFDAVDAISVSAINEFYHDVYTGFKKEFVSLFTETVTTDSDGVKYFYLNSVEAEELFANLISLTIPILLIAAMLTTGVTIKLFDAFVKRFDINVRKSTWSLTTPTLTAVFYIAILILASIIDDSNTVFYLSVISIYNIFAILYAYIGFKIMFPLIFARLSKPVAVLICIAAFISFGMLIIQIFSIVGVLITIIKNKSFSKQE